MFYSPFEATVERPNVVDLWVPETWALRNYAEIHNVDREVVPIDLIIR